MTKLPLYKPLTQEEVAAIEEAAFRVLEEVGIEVGEPYMRILYQEAGARVRGSRVYLPRPLVETYVAQAPRKVRLCGRQPGRHLELYDTNVYAGTGGAALEIIDLETNKPRPPLLRDIAKLALLVENLEHIHFYLRPCEPTDVPAELVDVNKYYAGLSHTTKHVMGAVRSLEGLRAVLKLGALICGGEEALSQCPLLSFICCWMISPLRLDIPTTEILLEIVRHRLPVVLSTAPMAGTTAPYTLAGILVQTHAELLSGIVLTQIVSPGAPVIYGAVPSLADMRSGGYVGGAIEFGMLNAAVVQLARARGLPIYNSAGLTEACTADIQAGIEKAFSVLQTVLAGGNFIHHAAGMLHSMRAASYAQYVIDNEILGMALRAARGIEVDEEKLAVDSIASVGPGGHFLMDELTLKYLRTERFFDSLLQNHHYPANETEEDVSIVERARQKAQEILAKAQPPGLPEDIDRAIRQEFEILL